MCDFKDMLHTLRGDNVVYTDKNRFTLSALLRPTQFHLEKKTPREMSEAIF